MYKLSKYNYFTCKTDAVYVYNFLHRTFLKLPIDIYQAISGKELEKLNVELLKKIEQYGVILPESVDENLVLKSKINNTAFNKKEMNIFLSMTSQCNFECIYCYQDCRKDNDRPHYISYENAQSVKEFIVRENRRVGLEKVTVYYFGGEPIIDIEQFLSIFRLMSGIKAVDIKHYVVTNGYNINDELISVFKSEKHVTIQITIDGDEIYHNEKRCRKGGGETFQRVYTNLLKICNALPKSVCLRVNVDEKNLLSCYTLIDKLSVDGVTSQLGGIIFEAVFDGQAHFHNCKSSHKELIPLIEYAKGKGFTVPVSFEVGPCISVADNGYGIDENLNTYICPGALYQQSTGYISKDGRHIVKNNEWYEHILNEPKCVKKCKYAPICYGGCVVNCQCRKEQIEALLPIVIEEKIFKYKSRGAIGD